jgi:glyoxylase-like metal-dependent hydrolase (beta-lactamase superfamily II)
MKDSGRLNLVEEGHRYEEGLSALPVNGHTISQQLPKVEADGKVLVFAADLLPTHVHVPLPWVMGYDMRPVKTLEEKEQILNKAVEDNWYFFLEHDADKEIITVGKEEGKFKVGSAHTLNEL